MATLDDLLDEQNVIRSELTALDDNPDTTEEDHGDLRDTLIKRWKDIEKRKEPLIKRMEDLKLIERAAQDPANREAGADGGGDRRYGARGPEFMQRRDPLADREETKDYAFLPASDVVARASTLTEMYDKRGMLPGNRAEVATQRAQSPGIARHMLLHGGDEYYEAFREYINDPTGRGLQRAAGALSLASAQGGYLLPTFLDPSIVLTTDGTTNPYRRLASVKQVTTNAYNGVNSAGVQAAYLDEATAAGTAAFQGVGNIQIGVKKAAAWIYGSLEANEDTNFADQLPRLLQDGKDILEEGAFAAGTGGTGLNQGAPSGIAFSLSAAQRVIPGTAGGPWVAQDVYNLEAALGSRFRMSPDVGFVSNITNINKVRGLSPSGAGSSFWATLGDGTPSRLLNHRIEESPSVTGTAAIGTAATGTGSAGLIFGDWSKFYIVDRIGVSMIFEPMIKDPTSGAPKGQQGWFYYWRSGSGVAAQNAFRFLTLG